MKSVAMVTGERSKRQKIIFHPQHSSFPFYKITPTLRQSNKQKKNPLTVNTPEFTDKVSSLAPLNPSSYTTPSPNPYQKYSFFFLLFNSTLTTTLLYLWIDFIVSIHSSSQMFTGSQVPGQTQEWPVSSSSTLQVHLQIPLLWRCMHPLPSQMTYLPKVLISSQGGATFPQAQTSHAGPRLVTSGLQAPPAATFFRYFVVLLDFIPSSTLPSNFPNVETSLTYTSCANLSLGISFFLSDLFPTLVL